MNVRRLGLILILGGSGLAVLAGVWFVAAFAGTMDAASSFVGEDYAVRLLSCLYSSSPICQGAIAFSEGPSYSPALFWIAVIALLAGVVVRLAAAGKAPAGGGAAGGVPSTPKSGELLGFIPPGQYARYCYVLALVGAAGGLILTPLAVVALAGVVLALLGLTVYRPGLAALDVNHLGLVCLVLVAATLLLLATRGSFLFLLAALAQIACLYVGFNSYRHGRVVTAQNLRDEALMAVKPGTRPISDPERH